MPRRSLAGLIVCIALVLGACSDRPDGPLQGPRARAEGPSASPSAGISPDTESGDEAPSGASPAASPSSEGPFEPEDEVLDVAIPEPATLDPMRIQDPASVLVARQLFEGLTRWDPESEEVAPAAAASWKVANKGRRFTFKLRPGMTFHDGTPVTARDFIFAFDRIARKRSGSDLAYTLELVKGFDETNGLGDSNHLSGLRAKGKRTLEIRLSRPFYELPLVLTHPGLVPLRRRNVAKLDRFLTEPVGNGPFQMAESWGPEETVLLEAYEGALPRPQLDGIRFVPFPDAVRSWIPFTNGDFDVAEVPAGQLEVALEAYGGDGYLPFLAGYYYGFNLKAPELKDRRLRAGVNRAIDREAIASRIYKGTMIPPRGIVPTGMPGFDEDACGKLCDHSPAAARRLVRKLPRKSRRVRIEFTEGEPHYRVARLIRKNLTEVGLKVETKGYPLERYLERLSKGRQSTYRLGWIAEYPSPSVFLASLFLSTSPDNHSSFSSNTVDALLDKAQATRGARKRLMLYKRAERKILAAAPIVPIGSFETHWAAQESVEGIRFDTMGGFDAVDVSLADEG